MAEPVTQNRILLPHDPAGYRRYAVSMRSIINPGPDGIGRVDAKEDFIPEPGDTRPATDVLKTMPNLYVDWKRDDAYCRAVFSIRDGIIKKITGEKESYEADETTILRNLHRKENWTREDRVEWERNLSSIVSKEVRRQDGLRDYRVASKKSPDTENESSPETKAVTRHAEVNRLSQDIEKNTKTAEYDCEFMSVTEGSILQGIEDRLLANGNGEKSPAAYYYMVGHTYDSSDYQKNGYAGGHAWIISAVTGNAIEATVEYLSPYRIPVQPATLDDWTSGKPQFFIDYDGLSYLAATSKAENVDRSIYFNAILESGPSSPLTKITVQETLKGFAENKANIERQTRNANPMYDFTVFPAHYDLIRNKISTEDRATIDKEFTDLAKLRQENMTTFLKDSTQRINAIETHATEASLKNYAKNRNSLVEEANSGVFSSPVLRNNIRESLTAFDNALIAFCKSKNITAPEIKPLSAGNETHTPAPTATAEAARLIAKEYEYILTYPVLINSSMSSFKKNEENIVALRDKYLDKIDPSDRHIFEKPKAQISAVMRDKIKTWETESRKSLVDGANAYHKYTNLLEHKLEGRTNAIKFLREKANLFCTPEDATLIKSYIAAFDATLRAHCKIVGTPMPELEPVDPVSVRTVSVSGNISNPAGDIDKINPAFMNASVGIAVAAQGASPSPYQPAMNDALSLNGTNPKLS